MSNSRTLKSIILFVLILILCISVGYEIKESFSPISIETMETQNKENKSVVISLEGRPQRLKHFRQIYDLPISIQVENAYDGINADLDKLRSEKTISERVYSNIQSVEKDGKDQYKITDYVSRGGIGCYLSHVSIWKKMRDKISGEQLLFVFEDDAMVREIPMVEIIERVKQLPNDWNIYLLGAPHTKVLYDWIDETETVAKLTQFCGTHSYIINQRGMEWLINKELFPIDNQIDFKLSEYCKKGLNIYYHPNKKMYDFNSKLGTDIQ